MLSVVVKFVVLLEPILWWVLPNAVLVISTLIISWGEMRDIQSLQIGNAYKEVVSKCHKRRYPTSQTKLTKSRGKKLSSSSLFRSGVFDANVDALEIDSSRLVPELVDVLSKVILGQKNYGIRGKNYRDFSIWKSPSTRFKLFNSTLVLDQFISS